MWVFLFLSFFLGEGGVKQGYLVFAEIDLINTTYNAINSVEVVVISVL